MFSTFSFVSVTQAWNLRRNCTFNNKDISSSLFERQVEVEMENKELIISTTNKKREREKRKKHWNKTNT